MDRNALIVLLVTVGIIVIVNLAMFGIVRGIMRGDNRWIRAIGETLSKPAEKSTRHYDELRRRMQELEEGKRDDKTP